MDKKMDKKTKDKLKDHINKTTNKALQKTSDPEKIEKLRVLRSFCLKDIDQDGALSVKAMKMLHEKLSI